jgi:hypothetical protein
MTDATTFFTSMAALSAATHTLVEHVFKQFMLGKENWVGKNPKTRYAWIHVLSFAVGGLLASSVGLTPLAYLGVQRPLWMNAIATGLLVSFGGGLFNDALGVLQEYKQAKEQVRTEAASRTPELKPAAPVAPRAAA